jgi:hypothetical protein
MSATPEQITLGMQIAAVEREIVMWRQVYPRQVGQGKMKQATADLQIAAMEAVLLTLKGLQARPESRRDPTEAFDGGRLG